MKKKKIIIETFFSKTPRFSPKNFEEKERWGRND